MAIFLQNPNSPSGENLLSELKKYFKEAELIRCAFAFATARGISILFGDSSVREALKVNSLELIIGMDAITDARAIKQLKILSDEFNRVSVKIFLPSSNGIFHPKISWTKTKEGGVVITGSGNLTLGGLGSNFEAFSVESVSIQKIADIEKSWNEFFNSNKENLYDLDSDEVRKAAEENKKIKKALKKTKKGLGRPDEGEDGDDVPEYEETIFLEELTEGRGGLQRDVGKWAADNFFNKDIDIVLTYVDASGNKTLEKKKRLTRKGSSNFAIDLPASKGLIGKDGKLPIAVFVKTAPHQYLYHILSLNTDGHGYIFNYLEKEVKLKKSEKARRLKKAIKKDELLDIWPAAPFWG